MAKTDKVENKDQKVEKSTKKIVKINQGSIVKYVV